MEQEILILSASQWAMEDEKTKEIRKGTTLWYIFNREKCVNLDGSCGEAPAKVSIKYDDIDQIKAQGGAPVKAYARFDMRVRANKPSLEIVSLRFPENEKK